MDGTHSACLVCNSTNLQPIKGYARAHLVRCAGCGFVFAQAIPTLAELAAHYAGYERGKALSPITLKRYDEIIQSFAPYKHNGRILDNGCGDGGLLQAAIAAGWQAYGTEFTDEAIAVCTAKGIKMHKGGFDPSNYGAAFFDVIAMVEVLEHIYNPQAVIRGFHQVLRPGGVLYLTTPNFNSLSRRILGPQWNIIDYPEHLAYYTPSTLDRLLTSCGFERIWLKSTGFSVSRFIQSRQQGGAPTEPAPAARRTEDDERLRAMTEKGGIMALAKTTINATLSATSSGDTLKAFYRRKG